jgi:predicted amidohydrolase
VTQTPLRVAAVQAESVAGDVDANVASAVHWVATAAARGARVVVLPELFLGGYDPETWRQRPDSDVAVDDPRLAPLVASAHDLDAVVLVGAAVRDGDRRTISVLCCTPRDGVVVPYAKQHLWHDERSVFTPGTCGASVQVEGWQIALGVCYDGCFPEHARAAAEAGAQAYACPSAYVVGSEHRRDLYYAARALDNGVYVVMAGLVGRCGALQLSGGTAIFDPQGRVVDRVATGSGLAVADFDLAAVVEARAINPYAADRLSTLGGRKTIRIS